MRKFLETPYSHELRESTTIFVFGSNFMGRHGKGAALDAVTFWGALNGVSQGKTGNAYAIPTKDIHLKPLSLKVIKGYVDKFLTYAEDHYPKYDFLVTPLGTGFAGYSHEDIAPLFKTAPMNCTFPSCWRLPLLLCDE